MNIKSFILGSLFCSALLVVPQVGRTTTLSIGDVNELGFVDAGIPAGDAYVTTYVNQLIGMSLGSSTTIDGNTFTRSLNSFSPLDPALLALRINYGDVESSSVTIDLGTGGYEYLMAKYDGPNFGSEVWYVGGLTGEITIPAFGDKYGISVASLFTPGTRQVPDGGSTVMFLGAVFAGMALFARRQLAMNRA